MVRSSRARSGRSLADAQERGLVAQNVVRGLRTARRGKERAGRTSAERKLKIGVDIPTPDEIQASSPRFPRSRSRTLSAAPADRDLHRPARQRAARPALGRRRSEARRTSCAPARRPLRQDRAAEVGGGRTHRAAAADGGLRAARASPRLPERPARSRLPNTSGTSITASPSSSADFIRRRLRPVGQRQERRGREVSRPAQPAPLLRTPGASTAASTAG